MYEWGAGEFDALLGIAPPHGYYFFACVVPGKGPGLPWEPEKGLSGVITYKVGEDD